MYNHIAHDAYLQMYCVSTYVRMGVITYVLLYIQYICEQVQTASMYVNRDGAYEHTYACTYMFVRNFSRSRSQQRLRYRNLRLPPFPSDCEVCAVVDPFGWIHFVKVLQKGTKCVHTYVYVHISTYVRTYTDS